MKISSFDQLHSAWKGAVSLNKACKTVRLFVEGDHLYILSTDGHRFQKSAIALDEHSEEESDFVLSVSSIKSTISSLKPRKADQSCFLWENGGFVFLEVPVDHDTSLISRAKKQETEYPDWNFFVPQYSEVDVVDFCEVKEEVLDDKVRLSARGQSMLLRREYLAKAMPHDHSTIRFAIEKNLVVITSGNLETILAGVAERC